MFVRKLRLTPGSIFRQDSAESSIMTLVSQNVGAIMLLPVMAVITLLVVGGGQVSRESAIQSEIKVANESFTSDIERATLIRPVSSTMVVALSDRYDKAAGNRIENAATADRAGITVPAANRTCRISIWSISAPVAGKSIIKNSVAWDDNLASCTLSGKSIAQLQAISTGAGATDVSTPVPSADAASLITYSNPAGRQMAFNNGVEIPLVVNGATTPIADGSGLSVPNIDPDGWYSPIEWKGYDATNAFPLIKTVKLGIQTQLEVTGQNNIAFIGTTNEVVKAIENPGTTLPPPVAKLWIPNPVTDIIPQRCKVGVGAVDPGGFGNLECIDVTWTPRPASECDVSQTLKYTITVTNKITGKQVSSTQTNLTVGQAKVLGIWNGNSYDVTVTARCFDGPGSDSTPSTKPFDQLLPAPRINLAYGVTEATHVATWSATSSDPDINYELKYQGYDSGLTYTKQTETGTLPDWHWLPDNGSGTWSNIALSSPNAVSATVTSRLIKAGFPDSYRILASVPIPPGVDKTKRVKSVWGYASIIYTVNATAPGVTVVGSATSAVTTSATGSGLCPAGTSNQWLIEKHRGKYAAPVANWNQLTVGTWGAGSTKADNMNEGEVYVARVALSCYTAFVPLPETAPTLLGTDAYNVNLTNDATGAKDTATLNRFNEASSRQQPNSVGRQNNSAISRWASHVRGITVPASPGGLGASALGTGNGTNSTTVWNNVTCTAGNSSYFTHQFVGVNSGGYTAVYTDRAQSTRSVTQTHNEASGSRYDWRVTARCQSSLPGNDLPTGVPVAQASGWAGWATSYLVTDVPGPSGGASVSDSSIDAGDSYYTSAWFTCTAGNAVGGGDTYNLWYSTSSTGYGGGFTEYPRDRVGYCEGAWRGTGYKNSGSLSVDPGSVYVANPPWPRPGNGGGLCVISGTTTGYIEEPRNIMLATLRKFSATSYTDYYTWSSSLRYSIDGSFFNAPTETGTEYGSPQFSYLQTVVWGSNLTTANFNGSAPGSWSITAHGPGGTLTINNGGSWPGC